MSTSERDDENSVFCGIKLDDCERLHQCLHQFAGNDERAIASALLVAITRTLGTKAAGLLLDALEAEAIRQ